MSIKSTRENWRFLSFAVLAVFLVVFSACDSSSGGGGGAAADGRIEIVTINEVNIADSPELFICALNEIVVRWAPNRNVEIDQVRLELTSHPTAPGWVGSGFTEEDTDYPNALIEDIFDVDIAQSEFTVYFKATVPDDTGDYEVTITLGDNGSFTYFPSISVTIPTADNPCLDSFTDPAPTGEGYAAAAPPVGPGIGVDGEMVEIKGHNISVTDTFSLTPDRGATPYEIEIDQGQIVGYDPITDLYTIAGRLTPGCGLDLDLIVENTTYDYDPTSPYVTPPIDDSAQRIPGVYTYTPVITAIDPATGLCLLGGETITIYGGGFRDVANTTAAIGDNDLTVVTVGCSQITATTPPNDTETPNCGEDLAVTVDNTDDTTDAFTKLGLFSFMPEITGIDPVYGPFAGGTVFTITGCGFIDDPATIVTVAGNLLPDVTTTEIGCEEITATTPRHEDSYLGELVVPVKVENPGGYFAEDQFTYKSRNIGEDSNYSDASLLGDYNWIGIVHTFDSFMFGSDGMFLTMVGSDFNPEFAPIQGGTAHFEGDGDFAVSEGADAFFVLNEENEGFEVNVMNMEVPELAGEYSMDDDGSIAADSIIGGPEMSTTGALAPDGNAFYVARTLPEGQIGNELYIFTRQPKIEPEGEIEPSVQSETETGFEPEAVSLNGKTMGVVAFVHEYRGEEYFDKYWWELDYEEVSYIFQGVAHFEGPHAFTLEALGAEAIYIYDGEIRGSSMDDDGVDISAGEYSADTSGLFTMKFNPRDNYDEPFDLFDNDEVFGIFTVTDNPNPEDAQLFAAVNLSAAQVTPVIDIGDFAALAEPTPHPTPSGVARSILLLMVPLSAEEKAVSNFGGEEGDMGWSQGLFGHLVRTVEDSDPENAYISTDAEVLYVPGDPDEVTEYVTAGFVLSEMSPIEDLADDEYTYDYTVAGWTPGGAFTEFIFDVDYFNNGFISADDSVNVSVSNDWLNEGGDFPERNNGIRLELEK